jgi:hypothetical protein
VWVTVEIFAFALFAASLHLLMGLGGMVSFGHAAYFGLGAYGAALLLKLAGWPMPLAFLAAPFVAAAGAALFGYFCVRLTSIYFAMLTLAFAQIVFAVVHQWDEVTGGDNGVLSVWPAPWLKSPAYYYYWALAFAGAGVVLLRVVAASPFGLALRAVRDHARRAEAVGISIRALQWTAFVVAGFFAGLAGAVFAFLKGSVFPVYTEPPMSVQPLVLVRMLQDHQAALLQRNIAQRRPGGIQVGRTAAHEDDIHMRRGATARRHGAQPGEIVVPHLAAQKLRKEGHHPPAVQQLVQRRVVDRPRLAPEKSRGTPGQLESAMRSTAVAISI